MCDDWEVAKMIQVRDVRPELHAELVRRARLRGMTLTDYVETVLEREVSLPDPEEWLQQVSSRPPVPGFADDAIAYIRRHRDDQGSG
jgi:hypothetical protein